MPIKDKSRPPRPHELMLDRRIRQGAERARPRARARLTRPDLVADPLLPCPSFHRGWQTPQVSVATDMRTAVRRREDLQGTGNTTEAFGARAASQPPSCKGRPDRSRPKLCFGSAAVLKPPRGHCRKTRYTDAFGWRPPGGDWQDLRWSHIRHVDWDHRVCIWCLALALAYLEEHL